LAKVDLLLIADTFSHVDFSTTVCDLGLIIDQEPVAVLGFLFGGLMGIRRPRRKTAIAKARSPSRLEGLGERRKLPQRGSIS